jgi:hypothetical protein
MPTEPDNLPLKEVFTAANGLVEEGVIDSWALGGALAAIYYVEPFTTYDADVFFIPKDKNLSGGIPEIYKCLQSRGWSVEGEHLVVQGFPVQFLPGAGLTEEAVGNAEMMDYEGVSARVFRPEYIIAIAASVGRAKDKARIEQMLEQADFDKDLLAAILKRYNVKSPGL